MRIIITLILSLFVSLSMTKTNNNSNPGSALQSQKPIFTFGIIADIQYSDYDPSGTRFYRSSLNKLREALTSFKNDSVGFVINLGDLIDKDFKSYAPVINIIDSSGLKFFNVPGNHDYSVEPKLKKKIPVLNTAKEGYYSFKQGAFRFIVLNGNEISTYSSDKKQDIEKARNLITEIKEKNEKNGVEWNGGIGINQIEWLTKELDDASAKGEKVFIICHFPVLPENEHNILNYKEILQVVEKYKNIIAWFNGHNHAGNYGNFNLIHFVTFKGVVETENINSFAVIEVYKNKLWIHGYGREKSQILAY